VHSSLAVCLKAHFRVLAFCCSLIYSRARRTKEGIDYRSKTDVEKHKMIPPGVLWFEMMSSWNLEQQKPETSFVCASPFRRRQAMEVPKTFSFSQCDWLGFDLDHTLIRYSHNNINGMIYRAVLKYLVEEANYPESLLEIPLNDHFIKRGTVIDKARGNILKLDKNCKVAVGYHGTSRLSKGEVRKSKINLVVNVVISYSVPMRTNPCNSQD